MPRPPARAAVFFALLVFVGIALSVNLPAARAMRATQAGFETMDMSPATLYMTRIQVKVGPLDGQVGQPGGTVTIKDNGTTIGTATPGSCRGWPCFVLPYAFEAGNHSIVGYYSGDDQFAASTTPPAAYNLERLPIRATFTGSLGPLQSNGQPPTASPSDPVTFTFKVTPDAYATTKLPTGTATFTDNLSGNRVLGTVPLNGDTATFTTTFPVGMYTVQGIYNGDKNFQSYKLASGGSTVKIVQPGSYSVPNNYSAPISGSRRSTTSSTVGSATTTSDRSSRTTAVGSETPAPPATVSEQEAISSEEPASANAGEQAATLASRPASTTKQGVALPLIAVGLVAVSAAGILLSRRLVKKA